MSLRAHQLQNTRSEGAPCGVSIRKLMLTNFRSYESETLQLDGRPVVLTGANGSGKTNVLEALSLFSPGRGLRSAPLSDLTRKTSDAAIAKPWAVSALVERDQDSVSLGTGLGQDGQGSKKRLAHIDGETVTGSGQFADHITLQWLTPQMDRLFLEGASQRRRFWDRLVLGHERGHIGRYSGFERALRERQKVLENDPADPLWLTSLEATMAENAVAVVAARRQVMARLAAQIDQANTSDDLFPRADLSLECPLDQAFSEGLSALEVEDQYCAQLAANRHADRSAGRALLGPHRTDLVVHHRNKSMAAKQCSTGEQKALLIGLILANARAKGSGHQTPAPVLLLDEIAAHLDETRRKALFDEICAMGSQAWMTGTDPHLFEALSDRAQHLNVHQSQIEVV
jgi:DNA replication and repair protein RecF